MDIVTLGEILIDMFPAETGRSLTAVSAFHPKPGGAPANVAVAARRLGARTAFIGKVGDDAFGYFLMEVLRREQVETRGMRISSGARTTMAIIAMPDAHTAEFVFYRNPGADLRLWADELDRELLTSTKALHIGSLSMVAEPARGATLTAVEVARNAGALISFDVNYRPSLWPAPGAALTQIERLVPQVDLLKVNESELRLLAGKMSLEKGAAALLARGPSLVVVTLGANGCYAAWDGGAVRAPAFEVDTVDAIGCGDAFVAGLLTRLTAVPAWRDLLNDDDMTGVLRYASAVGALTAQTRGVIPALPTAAAVEVCLDNAGVKNPGPSQPKSV